MTSVPIDKFYETQYGQRDPNLLHQPQYDKEADLDSGNVFTNGEYQKCLAQCSLDEIRSLLCSYGYSDTSEVSVVPPTVPLCFLGEVQLRFLCPNDLEEVRALCQDWFPIGESCKIGKY